MLLGVVQRVQTDSYNIPEHPTAVSLQFLQLMQSPYLPHTAAAVPLSTPHRCCSPPIYPTPLLQSLYLPHTAITLHIPASRSAVRAAILSQGFELMVKPTEL
jgi:hypothetical protein